MNGLGVDASEKSVRKMGKEMVNDVCYLKHQAWGGGLFIDDADGV